MNKRQKRDIERDRRLDIAVCTVCGWKGEWHFLKTNANGGDGVRCPFCDNRITRV